MIRREFLIGLAAVLASAPCSLRPRTPAQAAARPARIGILRSSPTPKRSLDALRRGLAARGYVEGTGFVFVYSFGDGEARRLPMLTAALLAKGVDVIVTEGNHTTQAALAATRTVPIVMATSAAPHKAGIVESLAHPGGNVTGLSSQAVEWSGKLVELAKEIVPGLTRLANFVPRSVSDLFRAETAAAGQRLGIEVVEIAVAFPDIDAALRQAVAARVEAAIVRGRPFFSTALAKKLVAGAAARWLPTVYESRDFVEMGGLVSFGVDVPDMYRRAAIYIDKILKGAKPGDLPVEQPIKFDLAINMKTAKTLGLTIPVLVLARADEVIE